MSSRTQRNIVTAAVLIGCVCVLLIWSNSQTSEVEPRMKHWYGEYCYSNGKGCEYHDGKGSECLIQVNDRDPFSGTNLRLKEGSCKVQ